MDTVRSPVGVQPHMDGRVEPGYYVRIRPHVNADIRNAYIIDITDTGELVAYVDDATVMHLHPDDVTVCEVTILSSPELKRLRKECRIGEYRR